MFNINNTIKQFLLSDTTITGLVGDNIYNLVVFTSDVTPVRPPYLIIEINSLEPYKTKDYFIYYDLKFSVIVLSQKYNEMVTISEAVKTSLDLKDLDSDIQEVTFDSYSESFDAENEVYYSRLSFNSRVYNK